MPGIADIAAQVLVVEIGVDMPSAGHLVSWAGLCPRSDESAGKRRSTRVRKSSNRLKTTLVTAAWPAVRRRDTYLRAQFLCIKARRGPKKAISAPDRTPSAARIKPTARPFASGSGHATGGTSLCRAAS